MRNMLFPGKIFINKQTQVFDIVLALKGNNTAGMMVKYSQIYLIFYLFFSRFKNNIVGFLDV